MPIKANRREVISIALQGAGLTALGASVLTGWVKSAKAKGWVPLPPGASANFAEECLKCGLCVQACPYHTLKLARLSDPAPYGTPFFEPRDVACYMCADIPCVRVCPSGALDRKMENINDARMGVAVVDPASCLSWQGLRCEVCYRICPVKDKALTLNPHPRELSKHAVFVPTINPDHCTGCGLCVWSCPTQEAAINIVDRKAVLGRIGEHYRLGWKTEQPHHPTVQHEAAPKTPENAAPGGLDYLNNMDDPTL